MRVVSVGMIALRLLMILTTALTARALPASKLKMESREFQGNAFNFVRLKDPTLKLRLYWLDAQGQPYKSLADLRDRLAKDGRTFLMGTNSGIYSKTYKPLGLHIEGGKMLRPINKSKAPGGNFSMVPNGIFLLSSAGPRVIETSEFNPLQEKVEFATQSGPLLVHQGHLHPKFHKGSENRKLRSGVGVNGAGEILFAISQGAVNFYDFANFFKAALDCPNALYLDGTISQILMGSDPPAPISVDFVGMWAVTSSPE